MTKHVDGFETQVSKHPLLIELFCGLGAVSKVFEEEGWRCLGFDIERHIYGPERYPCQLVLQDVLTLHGRQFRDADFIWASPPCFVSSTLILTARGLIAIPEVVVGDLVLTHRNRWRKVVRMGSAVSPTVIARGHGAIIEGTAEHPIYVRRNNGGHQPWKTGQPWPAYRAKQLGSPEWKPLAECEGLHWASPVEFEPLAVPELPNGLVPSNDFWWMVGRWVGDGWVRRRGRSRSGDEAIICCANTEADELSKRLSLIGPRKSTRAKFGEIHWRRSQERTTTRFSACSNALVEWLICNFGRGASEKSWPAWTLGMDTYARQSLLDGYVSADGYAGRNSGASVLKTSSVSKKLAIGTRFLAASLGCASSVYFSPKPHTHQIEQRTVRQRDAWETHWTPNSEQNRLVERKDGLQWGLVRKVADGQPSAQVWNLEVEEDNTYVANGIVVHNCQEYSYMAMPWKRGKQIAAALHGEANFPEKYTGSRTVKELTALFDACFRIHREAIAATARNCPACGGKGFVIWYVNDCRPCERCGGNGFVTRHIPMVVENVKGAQPWVGQARANFGSFFLWGDIGMANENIVVSGAGFGDVLPAPGRTGGKANPDGTDHPQGSWFAIADSRQRGVGTKMHGSGDEWWDKALDDRRREATAVKNGGDWFGAKGEADTFGWQKSSPMRNCNSKSTSRKAASALIAKIPEALSRYLARAFNPGRVIARGGIATRGGH